MPGNENLVKYPGLVRSRILEESLSLHPQVSAALTHQQRSVRLQKTNTITENHNLSKFREQRISRCPASVAPSTTLLLRLRLRNHQGRGGRRL